MDVRTSLRTAMIAIGRHRLRSALTLVGITIGVAVVIAMVAVGLGAEQSIEQQVRAAGANLVTIVAGNYSPGDQDPSSGDVVDPGSNLAGGAGTSESPATYHAPRPTEWAGMQISPRLPGRGVSTALTTGDAAAIRDRVPGVRDTVAGVTETAVMSDGTTRVFGRLQGTEARYAAMRGVVVRSGRFLSRQEVESRAPVIVLSDSLAGRLYDRSVNPIGRSLEVRQRRYTVVGIIGGGTGLAPAGSMDEAFVPYTTLQDLLKISYLHSIGVSIAQAGEATRVTVDVVRLLRERHRLRADVPDDFTVRTQARDAINGKGVNPLLARAVTGSVVNLDQVTLAEIASSLERASRTMTALLASVAAVSLLVGGIGIMNIMLVSVTERTREIGLRMALGARGRDVLFQFLTEATTLSFIGGVVGVALGIAASGGLTRLMRWSTVISPASVVAAVAVAAAVGIFFGFYPARQASRLDPIDALRFE
jgi:putative ABC transport system permease protein